MIDKTSKELFSFEKPFEEKKEVTIKQSIEKIESGSKVPSNYIPISLPSNGRLGYPKVLHFRNFSMDELIDLSSTRREKTLITLIKCLNQMVFEGYDLINISERDLEVIMLGLFHNFQGDFLLDKLYYIDEDLKEPELSKESNLGKTNLAIAKLPILELPETFQEPFSISNSKGVSVSFILPKLSHLLVAEDYVNKLFQEKEVKFQKLTKVLEANQKQTDIEKHLPVDPKEQREFEDYTREKGAVYLKTMQSQLLSGLGRKKFESIEEKLNTNRELDSGYWKEYNRTVGKLQFGISPVIEFYSQEHSKTISRRFSFQPLEFLPSLEQEDDRGYTVQFGNVSS